MDSIILVIYLLGLIYALLRILNYLDSLIMIALNQERFTKQLEGQQLATRLKLEFDWTKQTLNQPLDKIKLKITNKSENTTFYVDWQRSTITDFEMRSLPVVRMIPEIVELLPGKYFSVIAPGQTLEEQLTTETALKRDDKGNLTIDLPLFTAKQVKKAEDKHTPFFLNLCLQSQETQEHILIHSLSCEFTIEKMPFRRAIVWKPKPKPK